MRNDQPGEDGEIPAESNAIFGTYIDKDSSQKPSGIKKMLKVSFEKCVTLLFYRDPSQDLR